MKNLFQFILVIIFFLIPVTTLVAQSNKSAKNKIEKGTILSSFNANFSASGKDQESNQVSSFDVGAFNLDALYFISKYIGIGPLIGLQYAHQFTNYKLGPDRVNTRDWNFEYGAKVGYYIPANSLLNSTRFGDAQFFSTTGISWVKNTYEFKSSMTSSSQTYNYDPQFRYQIAVGMYIPFGEKIGMEWKLQREAWEEDFTRFGFSNDQWSSVWSLGLALKVKF